MTCGPADLESSLEAGLPPVVIVSSTAAGVAELVERARSYSGDVAIVASSETPPSDDEVSACLAAGADFVTRPEELGSGPLAERSWYRWALAHRCAQAGDELAMRNASEVRERIVSVATHDLRTPLGVCEMAIELVVGADDPKQRSDLVARMRRALERMRWLIDDLRDYSALEAGSLKMERAPANVVRLLDAVNDQVSALAAKDRIDVDVVCDVGEDERAWVDRRRIIQALVSLMANSVKCTPSGGRVELGCERRGDQIRFHVTDSGPVIPLAEQQHMFEQPAPLRSARGVALGLALARGIAIAHGGTLEVASPAPGDGGEGATFTISVPRGSAPVDIRTDSSP